MDDTPSTDEIAQQVSSLLQQIENCLETREYKLEPGIKVPYGVVRKVKEDIRREYKFVAAPTLRQNICYAVEALDFYRWLINRFDLYASVESYLYKTGIILVDMIVEAIAQDFLRQKGEKPSQKHSRNIKKLSKYKVSDTALEQMNLLHQKRKSIHLHLVPELEVDKYKLDDWNDAIKCLHRVKKEFHSLYWGKPLIDR